MTDSLRYPIGPFERPAATSPDDRRRYVQQIEALPDAVRTAVSGLSGGPLDTSYRPGGWTVRQVVHHLADSHLNGYVRFRWALTEDEPAIKTYDQVSWAELDDARRMGIEPSIRLLDALHARWVHLCRALTDAEWEQAFHHPKSGRMTLAEAAALYAWHGRHHVAHITMWREQNAQ